MIIAIGVMAGAIIKYSGRYFRFKDALYQSTCASSFPLQNAHVNSAWSNGFQEFAAKADVSRNTFAIWKRSYQQRDITVNL